MNMRLTFAFIAISISCALGVLIPKVSFHDATDILEKDIACAKYAANRYLFDNVIDPLLILKFVVSNKKQEVVYANAYTFFGINYATTGTICNPQTGALISAGITDDIWTRSGILDYLIEKPEK